MMWSRNKISAGMGPGDPAWDPPRVAGSARSSRSPVASTERVSGYREGTEGLEAKRNAKTRSGGAAPPTPSTASYDARVWYGRVRRGWSRKEPALTTYHTGATRRMLLCRAVLLWQQVVDGVHICTRARHASPSPRRPRVGVGEWEWAGRYTEAVGREIGCGGPARTATC